MTETYGSTKFVLDAMVVRPLQSHTPPHPPPPSHPLAQSVWARHDPVVPAFVICPGVVNTEITPTVFLPVAGILAALRGWLPGFNITPARGAAALVAAAVVEQDEGAGAGLKHVCWRGRWQPCGAGGWSVDAAVGERALAATSANAPPLCACGGGAGIGGRPAHAGQYFAFCADPALDSGNLHAERCYTCYQ